LAVNGDHVNNDMTGGDIPCDLDHDNYTFADLMALANSDGEPLEIQPTI